MTDESRFYIRALLNKEVSRTAQKLRFATESIEVWKRQYHSIPVSHILLAGVEAAEKERVDAINALAEFEQEQKEITEFSARPITASGTVHSGHIDYNAMREAERWTPSNEAIKKQLLAMGTKGEGEKHD